MTCIIAEPGQRRAILAVNADHANRRIDGTVQPAAINAVPVQEPKASPKTSRLAAFVSLDNALRDQIGQRAIPVFGKVRPWPGMRVGREDKDPVLRQGAASRYSRTYGIHIALTHP